MSTKKEKLKKLMEVEAEAKANHQAYLKEAKEYKQRIKPLVDFLRNKKLKFNHAMVGEVRIEYFRIDEYQKLLEENRSYIEKHEQLSKLAKTGSGDFIYYKRPEEIKIKYPKKLQPVMLAHADKKYASFRFDTTESKKSMTVFVVLALLMLVMFPIWPYELKYAIWLITLIITLIIFAIILVRLVVFLVCSIFNYHIWIFPNLFETSGFFDSFLPVLEVTKGDKSWFNIFIRLFAISSFMLLAMHIYLNPTFIDENIQVTKDTIKDMHDWGVGKISKNQTFSQRAITNLEVILNETADVAYEDNEQSGEIGTEKTELDSEEIPAQEQQIKEVPQAQSWEDDAAEKGEQQL